MNEKSLEDVYRRYGVPHQATDARGGWLSTHCPHCAGSADYHLGWSVERSFFRCWRCGFHPIVETLVKLLSVDQSTALDIARSIRDGPTQAMRASRDKKVQARVGISRYQHPTGTETMQQVHRRYLERRSFDPDRIEREWGVLGTGLASYLDEIDYRYRLLIPIWWNGKEVSFQTRHVSDRSSLKYISCPEDREVKHYKHILYGRQECWGEVGIVVEGVTDAWRLGTSACATFGVGYTKEQAVLIARTFRRVAVVFDPEPAAQRQARKLAALLRVLMPIKPVVVDYLEGDPGSMRQDDADALVRDLTR